MLNQKLNNNNNTFLKTYSLALVVFLASFVVEEMLPINADITRSLLVILIGLQGLIILKKGKVKLFLTDILILFFIVYVFLIEVIHGSDLQILIGVILGSIYPYFLGRMITPQSFKIISKYWSFLGLCLMVFFLSTIELSNFMNRGGEYANAVIAMGEVFCLTAIFSIILYSYKKNKVYLFIASISIIITLVYLGSRGAFFSLCLSLFFFYKLNNNGVTVQTVIKKLISISLLLLFSLILIRQLDLFKNIPILNRFLLGNIIVDPSIVGNSSFLGRFDLIKISLQNFFNNPLFGSAFNQVYAHNIFIEILSAYGIIGIMLFTTSILSVVRRQTFILISKNNLCRDVFICFLFTFLYRMSSFSLLGHKSLFFFLGVLVSIIQWYKNCDSKITSQIDTPRF